jgi:hypothetical protein
MQIALAAALMAASPLVVAPADGATYKPGTATAYKVKYNATSGKYDYHCNYKGWRSGAKVTFRCNLYLVSKSPGQPWTMQLLDAHKGSWTPPPSSHRTKTYSHAKAIGQPAMCVKATALSVDGGDSAQACNF